MISMSIRKNFEASILSKYAVFRKLGHSQSQPRTLLLGMQQKHHDTIIRLKSLCCASIVKADVGDTVGMKGMFDDVECVSPSAKDEMLDGTIFLAPPEKMSHKVVDLEEIHGSALSFQQHAGSAR